MRHETLLKIIIAVFAIILVILGTFAYGNFVRNKQANNQQTSDKQASTNKPTETPAAAPTPAKDQPHQPAATPSPTTPPVSANQTPPARTPATGGAQDAVLPATILAVMGYILLKNKNLQAVVSKSSRS